MCLGIVRLQFQGPPIAGDRFVHLPLFQQDIAQIIVRFKIAGPEFHGPPIRGDRFVGLLLLPQGVG